MRVALATCEHPITRDTDFDHLAPALRRRGSEVAAPVWSDPGVDWGAFELVMVSSTWDYHTRVEEFREWLRSIGGEGRLRNEAATIEWNLDKRYLRELERTGVPTIPTIWTEPGVEAEIERTVAELGWSEVVVKPVVDLGAQQLARVPVEMVGRILRSLDEPGMAQPYLETLETEGELSLVFIAGSLSHAVRKQPARGDFRVQPQYGGSHERVEPEREAIEIAERALAAAEGAPLYARVDLVRDGEGALRVIELELAEPRLYLETEPASAELLARELLASAS